MKVTIIYNSEVCKKGLVADWGFSCLVGAGVGKVFEI